MTETQKIRSWTYVIVINSKIEYSTLPAFTMFSAYFNLNNFYQLVD